MLVRSHGRGSDWAASRRGGGPARVVARLSRDGYVTRVLAGVRVQTLIIAGRTLTPSGLLAVVSRHRRRRRRCGWRRGQHRQADAVSRVMPAARYPRAVCIFFPVHWRWPVPESRAVSSGTDFGGCLVRFACTFPRSCVR